MSKARVLYVSQEIVPFLPETRISSVSRYLPQGIHEKGKEIRVFMPRYGKINERRHQLHEVIRLSGMNLIINDSDHPLIIKVASIPTARMQVYFIDNEEYFMRKAVLKDEEEQFFADNDERAIFFARGVVETVKKLGWAPDIVHCHGWMSAMMPLYLKTMYNEDPHFADAKVIYSVYEEGFPGALDKDLTKKLAFDEISAEQSQHAANPTFDNINKMAAQHADAVIYGGDNISGDVKDYIATLDKPTLEYRGEEGYVNDISQFYDNILEGNEVLVEE